MSDKKKHSIHTLRKMKTNGEKVAWLTAYDYPTAEFAEAAGMDMLLVGDSLGMCVYGYDGTVPVTMDQCIVHCDAVRRGAPNTFIMGDMPFLSYQVSDEDAVRNAGRFLKEAGVDCVKLEGGKRVISRIRAILDAGIVVCGHIGLTPQSSGQLGGHKAQGRTIASARVLIEDALAIEDAGVSGIKIIGFGGSEVAIAAISSGAWFGDVFGAPFTEGQLAMNAMIAALRDGTVTGGVNPLLDFPNGGLVNASNVADFTPAASMTAVMSSMRRSKRTAPSVGSDSPVPRLSNTITRANEPKRSANRAKSGLAH